MPRKKRFQKLALILILVLAGFKIVGLIPQPVAHWNHKVYVAFGFHGNLYHSFRG